MTVYAGVAQSDPVVSKITMSGPFYASTTNNITAKAGGGQTGGSPMLTDLNLVTVCATIGDSVTLPTAEAGREVTVANLGAASLNVFPNTGDKVNAGVANAAYALAAGKAATFYGAGPLQWVALLSA